MKFLSFFILRSVGEAIFPLEKRKFCWVKFENVLGNGFEKYSFGRLNFSFGEGFVGLLHRDVLYWRTCQLG